MHAVAEQPTKFHHFIRWFLPWLGVSKTEKTVVNISATIEYIENCTRDALTALQEVQNLSQVVLQNQMALDLLLASQGICTVINTHCCVYIDQNARVSKDVHEIWKQTQILHQVAQEDTSLGFQEIWNILTSFLADLGWLKRLFIAVIVKITMYILPCILIQYCSSCSALSYKIRYRY